MSSYSGRHAELYDVFYADKPYAEEAQFVDRCLRRFSRAPPRRLLELACGTGRHALALAQLGYDVLATDSSQDMLRCARRRVSQSSSGVDVRLADMRHLDLNGERFDAAICLFDSIGYVRTNEAVMQVFGGVRRHLWPGALFVFEFWHAAAMLRGYDPLRVRRWTVPEGQILRISKTSLNSAEQTCRVNYTVYELRKDGSYHTFDEVQVNRFFLVQEMSSLLAAAGMAPLKWFAGFIEDEEVTEETWHVLAVARHDPAAASAAA